LAFRGFGWQPKISTTIGYVVPKSEAEKAGLLPGDHITHLNQKKIDDWTEISPLVGQSKGKPINVRVLRDGKPKDFVITPVWEESQKSWVMGITGQTVYTSENLKDSIVLGTKRAYLLTVGTFKFLFRLIAGKEKSESVGGPIMIAKMMGEAAQSGVDKLLILVAFISLQFAIFNLLPIPALDGGHIFFLIFEVISGKALSKNLRLSIQRIGFSLLLLLILYISVKDGFRLFNG
jgi:regulator of sigma E protease